MENCTILTYPEIEFYVETMRPQNILDIGNESWLEWHDRCQKLNQQATVDAISMKEEQVKETLITLNKSCVLVHEAILINIWKRKILPQLWNLVPNPKSTLVAYTILYHEAVVANLLELLMYHDEGSASLGDISADLLEYAYDYVSELVVSETGNHDECGKDLGPRKELDKQEKELEFAIGIKCVTIIRYMAEHLDKLSLGIATKMYETYDIPVLFVQLLLKKPWQKNGEVFNKGKWCKIKDEVLSSTEAQVWLALRFLLLSNTSRTSYCITDGRKQQLMKLLSLLTPVLLDQMSPLIEVNQWLCQLSVTNPNSNTDTSKPILIEAILDVRKEILNEIKGNCKTIAKKQINNIFCISESKMMQIAQKLSTAYNTDVLQAFEDVGNENCSLCGDKAVKRCSKCKKVWYCSRECQVLDWDDHKETCCN